jgi:signal transduction histidine kinase
MSAAPAPQRRSSVLQRRASLGEVLDLPAFQDVVKSFVDLYKIGIKVFDERGARLADVKVGHGDFCGYVFNFPDGRNQCVATVARVKDGPLTPTGGGRAAQVEGEAPVGLLTIPCFTGLRYLVLPVRWEGDLLGRIVFGPFQPADAEGLPASLTSVAGLELTRAEELVARVRRAPEASIARVVGHFARILEALVASGQKVFLTSQVHIEATLEAFRELEQRAHRLETMNARLSELDKLKSVFLATVSHELRTPLTSIMGYSEMLSEGMAGPLAPEQEQYVHTIMDKGETLLRLISSIMDLSQIEAGRVRILFEPLVLRDVLESALSSLRPQAQKKDVALTLTLPEAGLPVVHADRERLKQVLVNLLANALKFTARGGRVSLSVSEVGPQPELQVEGLRVTVEDTGLGIPPEHLERIFQSFYQVDGSSTREHGGAGLGLAIVKGFVEAHGGQVQVASMPGQGSRFTVVLPVRPPETITSTALPTAQPSPDRF